MWFSVVCTLIDNHTRYHSGQKCCGLKRQRQKLLLNISYNISATNKTMAQSQVHGLAFSQP